MSDYIRGLQAAGTQVATRLKKHRDIDTWIRRDLSNTTSPDDIASLGARLKANHAVVQELEDFELTLDGIIEELKEKLQEKDLVRA